MPTLDKKQLNVSQMVEECMKYFTVQSSQLALVKDEKDRLRHELDEKTQEAEISDDTSGKIFNYVGLW